MKHHHFPSFLSVLLSFMLLFPSLSLAEPNEVTALAIPFDPASHTSLYAGARILSYEPGGEFDDGYLTLSFTCPERYAQADILSLKAGDFIYAKGRKLQVGMVEISDGDGLYAPEVFITTEPDDPDIGSLWMMADADGNYHYTTFEELAVIDLEPIRVPFNPALVFLDGFDPAADYDRPVVHTAEEFLSIFVQSDPSAENGFSSDYIRVAFDADGNLVMIVRGY